MANPDHLAILLKGVQVWNHWREKSGTMRPDLYKADLGFRSLSHIDKNSPLLHEWDLELEDLSYTDLSGANLSFVNLGGANLNSEYLYKANLSNANLAQANLSEANLSFANLSRTNLLFADLSHANLNGANLSHAGLCGANLREADLSHANLHETNLDDADLSHANLVETDFGDAVFRFTTLGAVDLSQAKGLTTARHLGPSTIGIDTIYQSYNQVPEPFLRGCGVPEDFIIYAKSLIGSAIECYSCFISYSTKDQEFAECLHADLQAKGVRCWFAPHDVQGGRKLHEQIDEAIRLHDKLLLILSPNSMESEWVKTEISKARKREVRDKARVLFPISLAPFEAIRDWECFDADTGKDSAREVREYFIPDFSRWKDHDSYQKAFERLMRDLKVTQPVL